MICALMFLPCERLLRRRAVKVMVQLQGLLVSPFGAVLCRGKANKFERPFASHKANGMLFLQLNWLWVQLIVTLPITGTMPWYPTRCYQHRGLLPSYSFLNSGCKTTIFSWFCRYAKYSSSWNQKLVVRDASLCPILPIRLTKFNWLQRPSRGFLLWQAAKPSPDKQPNYFFIPPRFAFSLKLNFLVFPRLAFYLRGFCVNSPNSVFCYSLFT